MRDVLVLVNQGRNNYFPVEYEDLNVKPAFSNNSKIHRILRKFIFRYIPFASGNFFKNWIGIADKAKVIIVFDSGNAFFILRYLKSKYPSKRIILYYWNPVVRSVHPSNIKKLGVEIWSFDKRDCETYNLNYNQQFYFKENIIRMNTIGHIDKYDAVFIGVDKKRTELLTELKKVADGNNLNFYYYLIKSNLKQDQTNSKVEYQNEISYVDLLNINKQSKAIIDIVASDQVGMTLRPLEALFLKKKLITNMVNIKNYSLYNYNNVFIIGEDSYNKLPTFLKTDYDDTGYEKLVNEYCYDSWVRNFIIE